MCVAGVQSHANSLLVSKATFKPKPGPCGKNLPFRCCRPATTVLSPCWSRCRNVRNKRTKSGKGTGPAIGDSVVRKKCAKSAISGIRGCLSMLVILIKVLPEESRLGWTELGAATPQRLQIPPLRSSGAPVGMTRVGRLRSGRIATRMDGVRSGYSAKTADPSTALLRSSGRDDKRRSRSLKKKCEKSDKSDKSPILTCKLADFSSITEALLQYLDRQYIALRLEPTSAVTKQDDISGYALRISDFSVCHPASVGVAFPELSKLLNQEDALSVPCLRGESRDKRNPSV